MAKAEQRLKLLPTFERKYRKKTAEQQALVDDTLRQLARDPRYPGLHTHKIEGYEGVFESYSNDSMRVTWEWDGPIIVLRNTCQHDILKRP